ncbi:MAG TPA: 23S rRNA (adenine(2503)-C(2))-methyltransferase RlmN [Polyangiaceae bacterium]|jgi:23S rRNA (adenine2503-C2)-methyltransferase|nr:23S rRNA (adenine(2503)-C(2))-methyltransferase RlmN [Polyangiaceae bacterium]
MSESARPSKPAHPAGRSPEDWQQWFSQQGEPRFRAGQVFRWIHQRGVFDPAEMTDLGKSLRERLANDGLESPFVVERVVRSTDGTRKLLLRLRDGLAVECVLIPMTNDDDADVAAADADDGDEGEENGGEPTWSGEAPRRVTLCISTQVGCAMGCVFCASGKAGLSRGLESAEIVAQVLIAKRYLDDNERLRNLVFMGMGEPLHHYEQTLRALRLITHPDGIGMSPRRITVSTVGLVPNIEKLGRDFDGKIGLAVSLHAPDDETRNRIMPMNRRYDVAQILSVLRKYPLPPRRRITIEYTLIAGVNDSPDHARKLVRALGGLRVKVNLIPMNPVAGSGLGTSSNAAVEQFHEILSRARISCSVRKRRGDDVDAACGQLALNAGVTAPVSDDGAKGRKLPTMN